MTITLNKAIDYWFILDGHYCEITEAPESNSYITRVDNMMVANKQTMQEAVRAILRYLQMETKGGIQIVIE